MLHPRNFDMVLFGINFLSAVLIRHLLSSDCSGLQDALQRCEELLDCNYVEDVPQSAWQSRMEQVSENWDSSRKQIIEALIAREGSPGSCQLCCKSNAVIWCCDCNMKNLCGPCDLEVHGKMPLHDRQFFHPLGCFQPIPPTVGCNADGTSLVPISVVVCRFHRNDDDLECSYLFFTYCF